MVTAIFFVASSVWSFFGLEIFPVSSDHGNGLLTYSAALLTVNEVALAGHGYNGYLYIGKQ